MAPVRVGPQIESRAHSTSLKLPHYPPPCRFHFQWQPFSLHRHNYTQASTLFFCSPLSLLFFSSEFRNKKTRNPRRSHFPHSFFRYRENAVSPFSIFRFRCFSSFFVSFSAGCCVREQGLNFERRAFMTVP